MLDGIGAVALGAALMLFAGVPVFFLALMLFASVADRPEAARPNVTVTYNIDARAIHYAPPPPVTWAGPPALDVADDDAGEPVYLPQWRDGARLALPERTVHHERIS